MPSGPSGTFQVLSFVPLLFVVVGIAMVVSGTRGLVAHRRFLAAAVRVPGVVTGHDGVQVHSTDQGTTTYWHPVLQFRTTDGRRVDTRAVARHRWRRPAVGEAVEVLYDPADPLRATPSGASGTSTVLVPLIMGLVFIPLGLSVFVVFHAVGRLP